MHAATRRRAASGASTPSQTSRPLEDYCLCFSGKFPGYTHKSLHSLFMGLGASVTAAVSNKSTHLVCDEKDYNKSAPKVTEAKACGIYLVKPEWVDQVAKLSSKVDPNDYLWSNSDGDEAEEDEGENKEEAKPVAKSNEKKRPNGIATSAADGDGADEVKPKSKKAKAKASNPEQEEDVTGAVGEEEQKSETKLKEVSAGQFLTKKGLVIPLDEHCPLQSHSVYVEPGSGMIFDASLNQSSSSRNNNKFYRLQILVKGSDYRTWARWGRVGEMGQNAVLGDGSLEYAKKYFEKKFKDKSGLLWQDRGRDPKPNKYAFVERSYDDDPDADDDNDDNKGSGNGAKREEDEDDWEPPECTLSQPVREVMELIFNQNFFNATMSSLNYDANKLPLGKLSNATILRGFQQLKDLAALMDDPRLAASQWKMSVGAATEHLSNTFYSLIPHAFGRNRPPVINNESQLKKEIELLESLSDMKDASNIMKIDRSKAQNIHPMDSHFLGLGLEEMCALEHSSKEFDFLQSYLHVSKGSTHSITYKVHDIFRIKRAGEHQRFADSPFTNIPSDKRLLWHGSRCTNFGGILSQGLRIAPPEAPVSGYMFGKGIYLADMSSKSAGYCFSHISNRHALLLLCEAELGDPMQKLTSASYSAGEDAKNNGMYTTWGMGHTGPSKWTDAGVVHKSLKGTKIPDPKVAPGATNVDGAHLMYNEYICYDIAQIKLRYLFHVEI